MTGIAAARDPDVDEQLQKREPVYLHSTSTSKPGYHLDVFLKARHAESGGQEQRLERRKPGFLAHPEPTLSTTTTTTAEPPSTSTATASDGYHADVFLKARGDEDVEQLAKWAPVFLKQPASSSATTTKSSTTTTTIAEFQANVFLKRRLDADDNGVQLMKRAPVILKQPAPSSTTTTITAEASTTTTTSPEIEVKVFLKAREVDDDVRENLQKREPVS